MRSPASKALNIPAAKNNHQVLQYCFDGECLDKKDKIKSMACVLLVNIEFV